MARIGKLEVRTIGAGKNRIKVVKLPGHRFSIEHFLPENHKQCLTIKRATWIESKVGIRPTFIKKKPLAERVREYALTPFSELRLARYINNLKIPDIRAEEPLAVILHSSGEHEIIYREITGDKMFRDEEKQKQEAAKITAELDRHGIHGEDKQWFRHKKGITLFDLEHYSTSAELRRKIGLKYKEGTFG